MNYAIYCSGVMYSFSCRLYVVFWSFTLYDLYVPKGRYDEEISKAEDAIQAFENNQDMVSFSLIDYQ